MSSPFSLINSRVLAAIIEDEGRFFVCQRPLNKHHGGLWEFPGGKLEGQESLEEAAKRELMEELSLKVLAVGDPVLSLVDNSSCYLICFTPVKVSGIPLLHEHIQFKWASIEQLLELALAPTDRQFAQYLNDAKT